MSDPNPYAAPQGECSAAAPVTKPLELRGSLRVADVETARRVARRGYLVNFLAFAKWLFVPILLLFAFLAESLASAAVLLLPVLFALTVSFLQPKLRQRKLQKLASLKHGLFATDTVRVGAEGITVESSQSASAHRIQWRRFKFFRASDQVALVYFADANGYMILAWHQMPDGQPWGQLIELLRSQLPEF